MGIEGLLHLFHLFHSSLFGIFLHTGVEGGLDTQTIGIEVVTALPAPVFQIIRNSLTEVVGLAVVSCLYTIIELDIQLFQ